MKADEHNSGGGAWPIEWFAGPCGAAKREMIEQHLAGRGIRDRRVLAAMARVPREEFVEAADREKAYDDNPKSIGYGQTISQPFMVARTVDEAQIGPGDKVLEIGVGCGYELAVIREMGARAFGIEIVPQLAAAARARLDRLGYGDVEIYCGDGRLGLLAQAPFDAIVTAASPVSMPRDLFAQLKTGGRLIGPEGAEGAQDLMLYEKTPDGMREGKLFPVRYVPMTGRGEAPVKVESVKHNSADGSH